MSCSGSSTTTHRGVNCEFFLSVDLVVSDSYLKYIVAISSIQTDIRDFIILLYPSNFNVNYIWNREEIIIFRKLDGDKYKFLTSFLELKFNVSDETRSKQILKLKIVTAV